MAIKVYKESHNMNIPHFFQNLSKISSTVRVNAKKDHVLIELLSLVFHVVRIVIGYYRGQSSRLLYTKQIKIDQKRQCI